MTTYRQAWQQRILKTLLFLLVIGTTFGVYYYTFLVSRHEQADYFVEQLHVFKMHPNGELALELKAPKANYAAETAYTTLTEPHLWAYRKNGEQPWQLTAKRGMANRHDEIITVVDQVNLSRDQLSAETDILTYYPKQKKLMTYAGVKLHSTGFLLEGQGLRGDLNIGNIQLLSNVQGRYVRKNSV